VGSPINSNLDEVKFTLLVALTHHFLTGTLDFKYGFLLSLALVHIVFGYLCSYFIFKQVWLDLSY
jgi:hypothetical protein